MGACYILADLMAYLQPMFADLLVADSFSIVFAYYILDIESNVVGIDCLIVGFVDRMEEFDALNLLEYLNADCLLKAVLAELAIHIHLIVENGSCLVLLFDVEYELPVLQHLKTFQFFLLVGK